MINRQSFLENPRNWKRTSLKHHKAKVCVPPIGTKVFNMNTGLEEGTTAANRFVIGYANHFMHTVSLGYLNEQYEIKQNQYSSAEDNLVDWMWVEKSGNIIDYMAIHVPRNVKFEIGHLNVNKDGIEHGDGDYIVCRASRIEEVNLARAFVINGLLFPLIFNMQPFKISFKMKRYMQKVENNEQELKPLFKRKTYVDYVIDALGEYGFKVSSVVNNSASALDGMMALEPGYNQNDWDTVRFSNTKHVMIIEHKPEGPEVQLGNKVFKGTYKEIAKNIYNYCKENR